MRGGGYRGYHVHHRPPGFRPERGQFCRPPSPRPWHQTPPPPPKPPMQPPVYAVVLERDRRGPRGDARGDLRREDLEDLIADCPALPKHHVAFATGAAAGRLFFGEWEDALEAVAYFWGRRLDGAHTMTPHVLSNAPGGGAGSCRAAEEESRLRTLFAGHARGLLSCEPARRCEQKIEELSSRIARLSEALKERSGLQVYNERLARRESLEVEREPLRQRLEEFHAGISGVLALLGEPEEEGRRVGKEPGGAPQVFGFGRGLEWSRIQRLMERECRRLDEGLPIYACRSKILNMINSNQVLLLIGETGSGKSTQLVQFLADSGLASNGSIICTQPRKIAAVSLAKRVGEESYGCHADNFVTSYVTYSSARGFYSKVVFTTDHCFLQHCMNDMSLSGISYVIVDEAHERSLNTDLILSLVKKQLLARMDLRLIIMSATADANKLSDYFFDCSTFHVTGRSFPVEVKYVPDVPADASLVEISKHISDSCASYVLDVLKMVSLIHSREKDGSILAFLTSQTEVEWACENFRSCSAVVLPLHGKLSCEEQFRVFQNYPGKRKVIFSTNVAETSLTIPGIKYVVDSGMVKESRFEPSSGMNMLKVCRISQSSAKQRAGRAGRTEAGKCYRLYQECDFQSMALHQEPEIRKVHLGIAVLKILALGVKNVQEFEFVDAPSSESVDAAIQNLTQLGAVVSKHEGFELTGTGRCLVKLGIEPRLGKMILDCHDCGLSKEGVVLAAVMANSSSIFCRVGSDEEKLKADSLKIPFCHRDGDLFTLLSVYKEWEHEEDKNKWCWHNSINAKSMRRCQETITELDNCLLQELNIIIPTYWKWDAEGSIEYNKALKKVILSSLAENVAMFSGCDQLGYEVALTGQHLQLHPSCSLLIYGEKPHWVVFGEILSMTKQYLVCVTAIESDSLYKIQPPPLFDVTCLERKRMVMNVIIGVTNTLLRRLCGKASHYLQCLISRIQRACLDDRISIAVDFDRREIRLYASPKDVEKASSLINDALDYETKCLRDECIEKCLYLGGPRAASPKALFGSGAEIKHLELDKRYLTVEVWHPNAHSLDDKELLMMIDQYVSGIGCFHRTTGIGEESSDSDKWGRITFLSPEDAEKAISVLNKLEFQGSVLTLRPLNSTFGGDAHNFPAVTAKVCWPRRPSKGVALIRCAWQDADFIVQDCANLAIGGNFVRCEVSTKFLDCVIVGGLNKDISEEEIRDALRNATRRNIMDVHLLRGNAVDQPSVAACEEVLLKEISPFMRGKFHPSHTCRVQVFEPEPKDTLMRALITFDGSLHLEAARALDHLNGMVLSGCQYWQKIQCQQIFRSSLFCPAYVYRVIRKQLDSLLESLNRQNGVRLNLEKNDSGLYRVRISAKGTKTIADLRKPLEKLMKGKTVTHPGLTPSVVQLLSSRDGVALMKSLEWESGTHILYDKPNLNVRIFGSPKEVDVVEKKLVKVLLSHHENKQFEIRLRGGDLPSNFMKEVVKRFGPDMQGLKQWVPEANFLLNTRRHILSVRGSKEEKKKVDEIITEVLRSIDSGGLVERPSEAACVICLCELEEAHQLESCGHVFCRGCLIEQFESAIRSRDGFPLCCSQEGCRSPILLTDLRSLLLNDKLEELFRASLTAYVAFSSGTYRFCPSPDCPGVYRVADSDAAAGLYVCGACTIETCTKCHLEYHPWVSCEKYREFKENPDTSLEEWRMGKYNVKDCPACGHTIEKTDGCNHVECRCGKHICWECLEQFENSDDCYAHLHSIHQSLL
uniref:RNA helicase n=1 Tax=Anthurium amnicola TaxID=1678845 RepID=A0A1D1XVN8_9ARAE